MFDCLLLNLSDDLVSLDPLDGDGVLNLKVPRPRIIRPDLDTNGSLVLTTFISLDIGTLATITLLATTRLASLSSSSGMSSNLLRSIWIGPRLSRSLNSLSSLRLSLRILVGTRWRKRFTGISGISSKLTEHL